MYEQNMDLPPMIRNHLPEHAQDIYLEAFNHAFAAQAGGSGAQDRLGCGQTKLCERER